jgi:ATP-dependent HslUV protease ATP-binding subunit HslU
LPAVGRLWLEVDVENLTPQQIVTELDKYIVGQMPAKRAIAVALRNRYRRQQLPEEIRRDVLPKNILMYGPTGVGKTEIARRVARLLDAPFIKVEATRFTEAGYVGEDVETIVFDLVDAAIDMVHNQKITQVQDRAEKLAQERLVGYLYQQMNGVFAPKRRAAARRRGARRDGASAEAVAEEVARPATPAGDHRTYERSQLAAMLAASELDAAMVEIELTNPSFGFDGYPDQGPPGPPEELGGELGPDGSPYPSGPQKRIRRVSVKEARRLLVRDEANKMVDFDEVIDQAIQRAEQSGVVFIDELDKIAGPRIEMGSDVSGEGVQRDLLPIVEGTAIITRYGPVRTDHVLFVGAGSFYRHKPSDLIPELQGRFPLRVELEALSRADFRRILLETESSLIKQSRALLATEGVDLQFSPDAIDRIADFAFSINESTENIGARRLQTVVERVLEEISFDAPSRSGEVITIDAAYVDTRLKNLAGNEDLSRYIL